MAVKGSAIKAAKQSVRRRLRNRSVRSVVKTHVRRAEFFIESEDLGAADVAVDRALRVLDRAAKKGVIHANNAAKRKSRLMRKLNQARVKASAN